MFLITFSKAGQEDIVLTEDDLFDFQYEASCYSGETFELGGVNAKTLLITIRSVSPGAHSQTAA